MSAEAEVVGGNARTLMAAGAMTGGKVSGSDGKKLGSVADVMIEAGTGQIAYIVLAHGGWLGIGERLFAVPWGAVTVDPETGCLSLAVTASTLDKATGFDKDAWPAHADTELFPA